MLPIIKLSNKEVIRIKEKAINYGGESIIVRSEIPNTVFKIYRANVSQEERKNKTQKLELIKSKDIKFIVEPKSIIVSDKKIIGHAYAYDEDDISMLLAPLTIEEKIMYLRRIKMILNYFKRNG